MDKQEYIHRTQIVREQLANDELFKEIELAVRDDERVQAMGELISTLRVAGRRAGDAEAEEELVSRNRDLIDEVRSEELQKRGLGVNILQLEEETEAKRHEKVEDIHAGLRGDESESELLTAFHLTNDEGALNDESLNSPLFKERTKMAFDAYRSSVQAFQALVDYNQMYGVPSKNVGRADQMRTEAHDIVAREVGEDLELEFAVARRLVAKIRDGIVPGSGEQEAYARSILRVGKRLAKRFDNDIADAVGESLRPVLGSERVDEHKKDAFGRF